MLSYPKNLSELRARFVTEESCRDYWEKLRWPEGYVCLKCGNKQAWKTQRGTAFCSKCRHQQSVTAGTLFQDSRIPLRIWVQAIWWFTGPKNGVRAQGVQRVLGMSGHEPAWLMLHKLRTAMIRPGRAQLTGAGEVDEAYLGGEGKKKLVGGAGEIRGNGSGRMRRQTLTGRSSRDVKGFSNHQVSPGRTIVTDGLSRYCCIVKEGYQHKPMKKPSCGGTHDPDADELMPRVHRVISLVKRWLLGTYQGRLDKAYLNAYLNEFTFRLNRRTAKSRGLLFYRLREQAVAVPPSPLHTIQQPH